MNPLVFMNTNWNQVLFFFLMNPLASMNEGSLFSNANTTSFMGNEIELLKYNFSRGNSNKVSQDCSQHNSLVFFLQ